MMSKARDCASSIADTSQASNLKLQGYGLPYMDSFGEQFDPAATRVSMMLSATGLQKR